MNKRLDAQQLVNAISGSLDLPQLSLSDIPIFPKAGDTSSQGSSNEGTQPAPGTSGAPTQAPSGVPTATPVPAKHTFTLAVAGAAAFDNTIRKSAYHSESKTYDYSQMFSLLANEFQADLCLATLENTLVDNGKFNDVNTTKDVLDGLKAAGLDMLSLGHEHILDLGLRGLSETEVTVRSAGFSVIGAHAQPEEAQSIPILNLGGVQAAFLHYTALISNTGKKAIKANNSAYALPEYSAETVQKDIKAARSQGAQVVIVLIHWGADAQAKVTKEQQQMAQQIADAGADILLGMHNQVVQPIAYLTGTRPDGAKRPTLVCYSLGALITGGRDNANIAGMILQLSISFDPASGMVAFDRVQYTPTYIWRYKEDGQYKYRAVASDAAAPESMDSSQQDAMARALDRIQKLLADSPAKQRSAEK
jgi:poly-gamma-glutamate synthesis protein (capsule biosynthesis protein)